MVQEPFEIGLKPLSWQTDQGMIFLLQAWEREEVLRKPEGFLLMFIAG